MNLDIAFKVVCVFCSLSRNQFRLIYCGMMPLLKFKTSIYHGNFPTVASLGTQCQVKTIMAELKRSANAAITALAIWWICELFRKDKFSCLESEFNREFKQ